MKIKNRDKNKKLIILSSFLVLLLIGVGGCKMNSFKLGRYESKTSSNEFCFYSDSSFVYKYYGMGYKKSTGKWYIQNNNFLLLNSDIQQNNLKLCLNKKKKTDSSSSVKLIINTNECDYRWTPIINGYEVAGSEPYYSGFTIEIADSVKYIQFEIEKFPQRVAAGGASVYPYLLRSEILKITSGESYDVTINVIDSLFRYRIFTNEKMKIEKKKIIFDDGLTMDILHHTK